jgi:four helix bundle protein
MKLTRFEDLECWQEARKTANHIYSLCNKNSLRKDYALSDQLKRSGISIMANIAEGFSRQSNKEFVQFLFIAKSSAAEVQSHLYIALDQRYIEQNHFDSLFHSLEKIQKQISNLIKYLKTTFTKSNKRYKSQELNQTQ